MRFLYLDDNDKVTRDGDVELINTISERIEIETDYPSNWATRSKQLLKDIASIDGIIIDWELTNNSKAAKEGTKEAKDIDFSAESLAEHLRVSVLTGTKDIPIILCSADKNNAFTILRKKELTSRDLFDLTFLKNDLFVVKVKEAETQLFDLATVYSFLQKTKFDILRDLCLTADEVKSIDIRFSDTLETIAYSKTTHDLVQFLLREFIEREGLLINEFVLAARLGIDIEKSGKHWETIKIQLINSEVQYNGLLNLGWQNYWAFKLETWWNDNFEEIDLRTTKASNRVKLLNDKFKLDLQTAQKIKFCSSEEFWTVCYGLNRPLDPINGFMVGDNICNPWIDIKYISGFAELEKSNKDAWKINVIDRERYNDFKSIILNKG